MVGEGPPGRLAMQRPDGGRLGWERTDEDGDPPRRDPPAVQVVELDAVVAEQVGLDRVAMGG